MNSLKNGRTNTQLHPFHIVNPSPWPLMASIGALAMTFGSVLYMHNFIGGSLFFLGVLITSYVAFTWWRDIVRESTYQGFHTKAVQLGLRYGMLLFIASEVMFFFAFFWAFFHSSMSPSFDIGGVFPPVGVEVLNPWKVPLLNTTLLLTSGVTITWAHHALFAGLRLEALLSLSITVALALVFTLLQCFEYCTAPFSISDSVYGSIFFMATGFHGFHVIIGTSFLTICLIRLFLHHFTREHHFGFEAAAWYWHVRHEVTYINSGT